MEQKQNEGDSLTTAESNNAEPTPALDNASGVQASKNNKRRPSGSPSSQTDLKKLHRDSSSSSQNEDGPEIIEIDKDETVLSKDCLKKTAISVRQKLYSDLLAKSLAASSKNASLPADLEVFQVEDPSDSLLLSLYNLALRNNVATDALTDFDPISMYKNLLLTPTIKNLYSPARNPLEVGAGKGSNELKNQTDSTAHCVAENNPYLRSMSKIMEKLDSKMTKNSEIITNNAETRSL